VTPSPYWTAYADALSEQGTVTIPNGDVKRLVEQLDALGAENDRLRQALSAAQTEARRLEQQLARQATQSAGRPADRKPTTENRKTT
jgi:regulator of replication initiation timing